MNNARVVERKTKTKFRIIKRYRSLEDFREFAIRSLQDKAKRELTQKLSVQSVKDDELCPSISMLECAFKSISEAIRAAGLYPASPNQNDLIRSLKEFYDEYGRSPRVADADDDLLVYTYNTYVNHFGDWDNALIAAERPVVEHGSRTKESLAIA